MTIQCDNQCETCGKYTEYSCLVANKDVKVTFDENGNEESREVY